MKILGAFTRILNDSKWFQRVLGFFTGVSDGLRCFQGSSRGCQVVLDNFHERNFRGIEGVLGKMSGALQEGFRRTQGNSGVYSGAAEKLPESL